MKISKNKRKKHGYSMKTWTIFNKFKVTFCELIVSDKKKTEENLVVEHKIFNPLNYLVFRFDLRLSHKLASEKAYRSTLRIGAAAIFNF